MITLKPLPPMSSPAQAPFHVMTKPIGARCNLDCSYKTDRTLTNVMHDLESYVDDQAAFYASKLARVGATTSSTATANGQNLLSTTRTPPETIQAELGRAYDAIFRFRVQREFGFGEAPNKAVTTGRYSFTSGRLKGLDLGSSVQWLSAIQMENLIRYNDLNGNFTIDAGEIVLDSGGNPIRDGAIQGDPQLNVDAFAVYRTSTRLLGRKLNLEFQLNVRNLLDDTDVVKQRLNGSYTGVAQYVYRDPRSYRFTVRWRF